MAGVFDKGSTFGLKSIIGFILDKGDIEVHKTLVLSPIRGALRQAVACPFDIAQKMDSVFTCTYNQLQYHFSLLFLTKYRNIFWVYRKKGKT